MMKECGESSLLAEYTLQVLDKRRIVRVHGPQNVVLVLNDTALLIFQELESIIKRCGRCSVEDLSKAVASRFGTSLINMPRIYEDVERTICTFEEVGLLKVRLNRKL